MRKLATIGALLLFAACKGSDTDPLVTTTVTVTSSPSQISVNSTSQASAVALDQNGNAIAGKTFTWNSLNPNIATVDATGLVRGIAAGTATIQATVDGVTGATTVVVIAPSNTCSAGPTNVDVPVGGVRVLSSAASQGCAKVSAVGASSRGDYVIIAASLTGTPDVQSNFILKSDEGETVPNTSVATTSSILARVLGPAAPDDEMGAVQLSFESKLRKMERAQLNLRAGRAAYQARQLSRQLRYSVSSAIPAVGDKTTFKIPGRT
ncbi:MAG TPA: Ig-like domain-containing protein, partial [Gemmatimonadaceae bacterium]